MPGSTWPSSVICGSTLTDDLGNIVRARISSINTNRLIAPNTGHRNHGFIALENVKINDPGARAGGQSIEPRVKSSHVPAMTTSEWQIQGWTPVRRDDGVAHWGVVGTYVSGRSCSNVDLLKKFARGRPNANLELLIDGLILPVGRRLNKHWAWNKMDVLCTFCMCMLYKWYLVAFPNSISIFIDP